MKRQLDAVSLWPNGTPASIAPRTYRITIWHPTQNSVLYWGAVRKPPSDLSASGMSRASTLMHYALLQRTLVLWMQISMLILPCFVNLCWIQCISIPNNIKVLLVIKSTNMIELFPKGNPECCFVQMTLAKPAKLTHTLPTLLKWTHTLLYRPTFLWINAQKWTHKIK